MMISVWSKIILVIIFQGYFNTAERVGKRHSRPRAVIPIEYSAPEHTMSRLYSNTDEFGIAVVVYEMIFGRCVYILVLSLVSVDHFHRLSFWCRSLSL